MNVGGLDGSIYLFFLFRQKIKISFCGRSYGFDDVLKGVSVDSIQEVKKMYRDFCIGQKERIDIPLTELFCNGMIIGKISVMNERFIHSHEWMSASGMPDFSLSGISLVPDPDMSLQIF